MEIVGVGVAKARFVAGLTGQPLEKSLQCRKRRVHRRLAEFLAGFPADLIGKPVLEADRLLDVEQLEVAPSSIQPRNDRAPRPRR